MQDIVADRTSEVTQSSPCFEMWKWVQPQKMTRKRSFSRGKGLEEGLCTYSQNVIFLGLIAAIASDSGLCHRRSNVARLFVCLSVCMYVCLCVWSRSWAPRKRLNRSRCRLGLTHVGPRNHYWMGSRSPKGKGQFLGLFAQPKALGVAVYRARPASVDWTDCNDRYVIWRVSAKASQDIVNGWHVIKLHFTNSKP